MDYDQCFDAGGGGARVPFVAGCADDLRLVAMTVMASTLAHELGQPLIAARNLLQCISRKAGKDTVPPDSVELLDRSIGQILKAIELIRRMRAFAMDGQVQGQRESVRAMVERVRVDLVGQGRLNAELAVTIGADAYDVLVDRIQIELVLKSLVANASDAVAAAIDPRVEVETRRRGDQIEITVRDSGPGLTAEAHARLLEPLFTTKPDGAGLGLPICRVIAEAHGGRLWADPPAEGGAALHLCLPAADPDVRES